MIKARILHPDGRCNEVVKPKNEKKFTKKEVRVHISPDTEPTIERIRLDEEQVLLIFDGKAVEKGFPKNVVASKYAGSGVAGDVLVCNKGEF